MDLITDVLHLLHSEGIDVDLVLRSSKGHFEDEAGEPPSIFLAARAVEGFGDGGM